MNHNLKRAWKLQEFSAHSATVNCVSLGRKSGRVLVTGGGDKRVNLWAVGKPNCIISLSGHTTPVDCVKFSLTEDQVCAGSQAGALKIWDLESAKVLRTLTGHRASIRCVDFHPYGDFLASGSSDSSIKMWDVRKKGCIFGYKGHSSTVNSLKFSPDGQWIASGGEDNYVKIWDIRVGKVLSELGDHNAAVTSVDFHPHEFLLSSGSMDRTVKLWDLETFQLYCSSMPDVPSVRCVSFHPDGSCLYAGSADTLRVHRWDPPSIYDAVSTSWSKIHDIAISQDKLVGVACQMTNVSIYVVDLTKVKPTVCNNDVLEKQNYRNGHSLRKNFDRKRSSELAKSLSQMKVNEDSDSIPTDLEDDSLYYGADVPDEFQYVFNPSKDLARTPPPRGMKPSSVDDDNCSIPLSLEADSPSPEDEKRAFDFRFVTARDSCKPSQERSPGLSPRRGSVPVFTSWEDPSSMSTQPSSGFHSQRHPSPDCIPSARLKTKRMNSSSDESNEGNTEPLYSSRSTVQFEDRLQVKKSDYNPTYSRKSPRSPGHSRNASPLKHSPSEPSVAQAVSRQETNRGISDATVSVSTYNLSGQRTSSLTSGMNRSAEKPLAQCQVKPIRKVMPTSTPTPTVNNAMKIYKTDSKFNGTSSCDTNEENSNDFIPICLDRPAGVAIDDFLPKNSISMHGVPSPNIDLNETEVIRSLMKEHQSVQTVLLTRQRNLRIIYNVWQTKDIKAALDNAIGLGDRSILVDIIGVLVLRPSIWNLDLCVTVLVLVLPLLESRYEAHVNSGCSALRLILKNFASVIKTNIESPIQTVGVDISREERYNKSMECYRHLIAIRSFTGKRQTANGKLGHTFRELHILLSNLD